MRRRAPPTPASPALISPVLALLALLLVTLWPAQPRALEAAALQSVVTVLPEWPHHPRSGAPGVPPGAAPEASAVAIAPGGYLATALHAVARAEAIDVRLSDGRLRRAELVGRDLPSDIALLKIEDDLPVPLLVDALDVELGQPVCAVGNAFGLGLSVTCGVVSALRRTNAGFNAIEDFVQTDAAINPGMSGGALFDLEGRLVGLLSAIFASQGDANTGVSFAVSAKLLRRVAADLEQHGRVLRGRSGLRVRDLTRQEQATKVGAVVSAVEEESAAAVADLVADDLIVEIAGRPIRSASDVNTALHLHRPGESFYITYRRGDVRQTTTMTLE